MANSPGQQQTKPDQDAVRLGFIAAFTAYTIWGAFPLYLKQIDHVSALEIVCQRILWAIPFCALILTLRRQWPDVRASLNWKTLRYLLLSATFISVNWYFYTWAVSADRVLEASLGYYINPLMFVAAGVLVLNEKLSRVQWIAIVMATIGVAILTFGIGVFPWVSFLLAASFTTYGFVRKHVVIGAVPGLFIETLIVAPIAAIILIQMAQTTGTAFGSQGVGLNLLLILAGPVTVVPLTLFAIGARRLQLSTIGFLQYIGPTGQFLLGLYYGEAFTIYHGVCFGLIWAGLALLSADALQQQAGKKR